MLHPKSCLLVSAALSLVCPNVSPAAMLADASLGNFPLVEKRRAAAFLIDPSLGAPVARAVEDLRQDIERVSGVLPEIRSDAEPLTRSVVIIGVVGESALLARLSADRKIDLSRLQGAWESFDIRVVKDPLPGISSALVIAGSDRRGAIYGCYEVSRGIGVSPWHWWADVPPPKREELYIAAGTHQFGPPSVKYRGIFINDEDWGLQPWAAHTLEPENGGIGPKTYAKVFELLLRLRANTLWPAMHECTKPFNQFPENKVLADKYGIVMGSSHAEPMLRNNVREWTDDPKRYNYAENRAGVLDYWRTRVKSNGVYENLYTLGMRGIHDSGMEGGQSEGGRIALLEQIMKDQRDLLKQYVRPDVTSVPQMFCAYKEVLELYRHGLKVPDDVTIVWPDDNFGYIRYFASEEERRRGGGFGVYYHLSYLGAPLSYLWIYATPPALIWEEMTKAYDHGARSIWIANVGDVKFSEIGTQLFLDLAWDINSWRRDNLHEFLPKWAEREFGSENAAQIAAIFSQYFQLNYQRKPEHLQWWLQKETPRPSTFTREETMARLSAFASLREQVEAVRKSLPGERQDAFYELVAYPVIGSALANERYFSGEQAALTRATNATDADKWLARANHANNELRRETVRFNEAIAGGKWRGFVSLEPAGPEWPQYRISAWLPPTFTAPVRNADRARTGQVISIEAENFTRKVDRASAWQVIPGLGRTGNGSVAVFPTTSPSIDVRDLKSAAPSLDYEVNFAAAGEYTLTVYLVPTQPIRAGRGLRLGFGLQDQDPAELISLVPDGSPDWAQSVMNATATVSAKLKVAGPGKQTLHLYGMDPGVVLDKIVIDGGGLEPSYLGPKPTQ